MDDNTKAKIKKILSGILKLLGLFVLIIFILLIALFLYLMPSKPKEIIQEIIVPTENKQVLAKSVSKVVAQQPKSGMEKMYELEEKLEKLYDLKRRGVISQATCDQREAAIFAAYME